MKLVKLNYGVWLLLLMELGIFGYPTWESYSVGALLVLLILFRWTTRTSPRWAEAKAEFEKANPLPPIIYDPVLLLFTLTALGLPWFSNVIVMPLYLFVALAWTIR